MSWISGDVYYMLIGPPAAIVTAFLLAKAVAEWRLPPTRREIGVVIVSSVFVLPALSLVPLTCCGSRSYALPVAWPLLVLSLAIADAWIGRWGLSRIRR